MHAHTNPYFHIALQHGAHRIGPRTDSDMQRWREYGLGQIIHFGLYSIPGGVWNGVTFTGAAEWLRNWSGISNEEYDNLINYFDPVDFCATRWARQAREMGVKYLVFTTKHHDGFALWPSRYSDFTIANTPWYRRTGGRDIVGEIVDAYTAEGISVYLYFSIIDWNHPGYISGGNINAPAVREAFRSGEGINPFATPEQEEKYKEFLEYTRNQLLELLERYPAIKGLWFDGSWDVAWVRHAAWVDALGHELRAKHPGLIIGSRFRSDEFGNRHEDANGHLIDDFDQRYERNLPVNLEETRGFDWDAVMTIPENQWGFHRDWTLTYVKTPYDLVKMLVHSVSLNGNLVINFGPDGYGNMREEENKIAEDIGKWMAKNSEAIYGTRHSSVFPEKPDWGYVTQRGDDIYLVVFNKPINNMVRVRMPRSTNGDKMFVITNPELLSTGETVRINGGGRPGTFYRDKFGYHYFDLVIPESQRGTTMPFVIKINVQEIDRGDMELFQQPLT
jgi:alpha-L-fucosidase